MAPILEPAGTRRRLALPSTVSIARYLERYAWCPHDLSGAARYERTLIVPMRAEAPDALAGHTRCCDEGTLVIAVVNGREGDPPNVEQKNAELLGALAGSRAPAASTTWTRWAEGPLLVLDHATDGRRLRADEGVGSARRVGFDTALSLWHAGRVASPWMVTSDADAATAPDHLDAADDGVARSHRFWHVTVGDEAIDEVTALYETWLRYFAAGLAWAGSPYAMLTIGSTMAVRTEAYAEVRGMPRKQAAEDFYFLNKLAKAGAVVVPRTGRVELRPRVSSRVPFGTGRTTYDWLDKRAKAETITWLAPACFEVLREAIALLEAMAAGTPFEPSNVLACALERINFHKAARSMESATSLAQRRRRLHEWLDAFRTLRLLHEIRDAGVPNVPWREALEAPFVPDADRDTPLWTDLREAFEEALPDRAGLKPYLATPFTRA